MKNTMTTKEQFIKLAEAEGLDKVLLNDYIIESEDQEGIEYWDSFESAEEALGDLKVYIQFAEPTAE